MNLENKEVLITGGTGSLGKTLAKKLQRKFLLKGLRIFSRDELKQWDMRKEMDRLGLNKNVAYLIGDVRDEERLTRAMDGVDAVINTAAMKQVPACESNPMEAIKTNIDGASNVIRAAISNYVSRVLHISTDKAVNPINLYGATKLAAEKLFVNANVYSADREPCFSCVRYGNVLGSRGSIIPLFEEQIKKRLPITITNCKMTRFWITLDQVTDFIIERLQDMKGREIFIPKMPSMNVFEIADTLFHQEHPTHQGSPNVALVGIRPGEKIHETLISKEEGHKAERMEKYFVIHPDHSGSPIEYTSNNNDHWLTRSELLTLLERVDD